MIGKHEVIVKNRRLNYKFTVYRNITILRGDSATGKTTLIEMIEQYVREGADSGVEVLCDKNCTVLPNMNWEMNLDTIRDSIVFIDEGAAYVRSRDFAEAIRKTDNYYVIATRDSLFELPYSVKEIYGIRNKSGNKYQGTKRLYSEFYPLYDERMALKKPDTIIIEDSNSAYQFFDAICQKEGIQCKSAGGKPNLYQLIRGDDNGTVLVIADGAAFGPEMERCLSLRRTKNALFFLPESFEWLILKSGLIDGNRIQDILRHPEDFIKSEKYMSWERFFTALLVDETKGSYLAYRKSKLNPSYINVNEQDRIMKVVRETTNETSIS